MFARDQIDAALARRLVDDQFPEWRELPIRPVELNGWDNSTFRLGDALSVRLPTGAWYAQQVEKEQRWLPVLAPQLPLPIPEPVALGAPSSDFPFPWSVYRWLDGRPAATAGIGDAVTFAYDVGAFLVALRGADAVDGPAPGEHNFFRGAPPRVYEDETVQAIERLGDAIDGPLARRIWARAVSSLWATDPVWFHGDIAVGNLLVRDGRLSAVIDFGTSGVGDPACDLVLAWTLFDRPVRDAFRRAVDLDDDTWDRARGWALWKALITLPDDPAAAVGTESRRTLDRLFAEARGVGGDGTATGGGAGAGLA
ncbi:aminoglycoside phosphotransferase family protein [Leifsonia sp. NPDC058230]|uniref:aminoglycoside phosphotransferase family protein n=1 Tax=Leifsonia sp. NPDC058230 TaxID=3346391 RepID=UPI0036DD91F4